MTDPAAEIARLAAQVDGLERLMRQRFKLTDRALEVALEAMNTRLEGMNEFRASLRDQNATYVTRGELDVRHDAMSKRITDLESARDRMSGRIQQTVYLVGIGFVLLQIGLFILARWIT